MAVAYASIATASSEAAGTLTITKPTGLAAGDLLVAVLGAGGGHDTFTRTGWDLKTEAEFTSSPVHIVCVLTRVADAGDAAATDFEFTGNSSVARLGALIRVTSSLNGFAGAANLQADTSIESVNTSHTFEAGVTVQTVGDLLIMGCVAADGQVTQGTYAITDNNPSWTERADITIDGTSQDPGLSVATATATAAAATGNWTLAISGSSEAIGYILSIQESVNVTVSPTVVSMTGAVQAPVVNASAVVSPAVVSMAASVQAPTVTLTAKKFTNTTKSSASSFTNTSKS